MSRVPGTYNIRRRTDESISRLVASVTPGFSGAESAKNENAERNFFHVDAKSGLSGKTQKHAPWEHLGHGK